MILSHIDFYMERLSMSNALLGQLRRIRAGLQERAT